MCDKAVDTYRSTIKFVPDCLMTQEMYDKAVNRWFLHLILFLINRKLKKCVTHLFLKIRFLIVDCPDKYKVQRMYEEAVDDSLAALKLIPDWFVTSKMTEKLFTALYADDNILYFNENSGNVLFSSNEMDILNIGNNNINLENNFDEDDPDTIILIRLLAWHIKFDMYKYKIYIYIHIYIYNMYKYIICINIYIYII